MAGEFLDPSQWPSWMNANTLGAVFGPQDEMSRALPGYESRDPNELAMMRMRAGVRPDAGRPDFPPEHLANMAMVGAMLSPLGAGPIGATLAPEFAVGRGVAAGAQYAPKMAGGGLLSALAYLTQGDARGADNQQASLPKDPKAIMDLQTQLKAAGYPIEKIDGVINPGGPTERAFRQYQADQAARRAEDLKRQELETQQGSNTATLATAKANEATANAKLEADRLANEQAVARLARKKEADERLRNIDKDLSTTSRIMRDYSGPAGLVLGGLAGAGGRWLTQMKADKAIKETAMAGDKIMGEDVALGKKGADAALARATRANAFWQQGGAREVPFLLNAEKAPGFAINPKATQLNSTYNPQIHPAVEAATAAPAGIEWAVSNHYKGKWEDELAAAQEAYKEDPSEINIQRINKAKDNVGLFTGLERFGQTALGVQGVGAIGSRYMNKGPDMRPRMQPAEAEQGSLQKILREVQAKAEAAAKKKGLPIPQAQAPMLSVGMPPGFAGAAATRARVR